MGLRERLFFWLISESKLVSDFKLFVFSFLHNLFINFLKFILNRKKPKYLAFSIKKNILLNLYKIF